MIDGVTTTATGVYATVPIGREDFVIFGSFIIFLFSMYLMIKIFDKSIKHD